MNMKLAISLYFVHIVWLLEFLSEPGEFSSFDVSLVIDDQFNLKAKILGKYHFTDAFHLRK